ncbi:MAG TPA: anti-sigma factor [Pyrinomonadaceae bacterium]|nr:anti-sigma factor [Pyrinomonadaceae bacterium]
MSRRFANFAAAGALVLALAGAAFAQDTQNPQPQPQPQTTTVTTQTTTQAVQNADGSWTVVQYPTGKEVIVNLTPGPDFASATGRAKVVRMADGTHVVLDMSGLPADAAAMNLYAVDPLGKVTALGPVTFTNGVAQQTYVTPLDRFMLVLSPESNLTTYTPTVAYAFRSAVPEGFAVVPMSSASGEKVAAASTAGATTAYTAPMLGIPRYNRGSDTEVKVNLAGALTGARVNFNIEPRKDGPTVVVARFHELKEAPAGQVYVLWAVSPDNKYTKLGQIVNTGRRNEAEIKSETTLADFGLLITLQPEGEAPAGDIVGTGIVR